MPLDPSILAQTVPVKAQDPLDLYTKGVQLQTAQAQNKAAQLQVEKFQREKDEMVKFQQELAEQGFDPDLNKYAQLLLRHPQHVKTGVELLQKLKELEKNDAIANIIANKAAPVAVESPEVATTNALASPTAAPVAKPANALAGRLALPAPGTGGAMPSGAPAGAIAPAMPAAAMPQAANLSDQAQATANKIAQLYAIGTPQAINVAKGLEAQMKFFESRLSTPQQQEAAARDQQRVALEQRRVELAEREQARKEAGLAEQLSAKERQKREATYPQATSAMKGFEAKSDNFVKDLQMLRDHPGLGEITGILAGRIGTALTDQGRAALALYNKVTAKGGFQALQDMREASKTGGALGNVSNQEGRQLVASFAAIDRTQNAKDVQAALNAAISDVEGAKARMREAYDATYEYRTQNAPSSTEAKPTAASAAPKRRKLAPGVFVTERP